jgi:hypothetical protein
MQAGNTAEACVAFEESARLDRQMGTVYNLAGCDAALGKIASAWAAYREVAQRDTNAARRKSAGDLAAKLEPRVAKFVFTAAERPDGFVVTMNGQDITSLIAVQTPIDLGVYEIIERAPGFQPRSVPLSVTTEGTVVTAALPALERATTPTNAQPLPPPVETVRTPAEPSRGSNRTGIVTAAASGGVLAGGLVLGLLARDKWREAQATCGGDARCGDDMKTAQANELLGQARTRGWWSTGLVAIGAAGVGAGIWMLVSRHDSDDAAITIAPSMTSTSMGLSLSGGF